MVGSRLVKGLGENVKPRGSMILCTLCVVTYAYVPVAAEVMSEEQVERTNRRLSHFSFGLALDSLRGSDGIGLSVLSPLVWSKSLGFRLTAQFQTTYGVPVWDIVEQDFPYVVGRIGVVVAASIVDPPVLRQYIEGGVLGIIPNHRLSDSNVQIGVYGMYGIEAVALTSSLNLGVHLA